MQNQQFTFRCALTICGALLNGFIATAVAQTFPSKPIQFLVSFPAGSGTDLAARLADTPDVPTVAESGFPGFDASSWFGLTGPAGVPRDIANKISADIARVLKAPDMRERFVSHGLEGMSERQLLPHRARKDVHAGPGSERDDDLHRSVRIRLDALRRRLRGCVACEQSDTGERQDPLHRFQETSHRFLLRRSDARER